jgi:hypothetical protein
MAPRAFVLANISKNFFGGGGLEFNVLSAS